MQFSVDDYYPPEWTAKPSHKYYFQIIKEGNLLGKIEVKNKDFNLIGRLEDLCDIHIDNPLVSRKHAIVQAKKDDPFLYLMDLGSQHGTFVNRVQLPPKTYKKIEPFDSLKFGVSSRVYILRCPEYQQMKESEQNQRENQFAKMLEEQHRKVSKEEMKAKYLDMLENDPYFAANQTSRQLVGKQPQEEEEDEYAGIDWGITDQRAVYAYKNDNEFPIEPDLLRRLNLDAAQLTKLSEYEDNLRLYQEIEAELNELTSKEKREYGLEEKLRNKKQRTQKKFMEALEAVEKCEDWLRTHIFGQASDKNKKNVQRIREKQNDTFGDDVFLDRTLQKQEAVTSKKEEVPEAETYWLLEAKLKSQTQQYDKLKQRLTEILNGENALQIEINPPPVQPSAQDEDDELDLFMKQNKKETDESNIGVLNRQMTLLWESIELIRAKLIGIVGEERVNQMVSGMGQDGKKTLQQQYLQKHMEQTQAASKKKMRENKNIEEILDKLEQYQRNDQEFDENKEQIFKYYKQYAQDKEEYQQLDEEQMLQKLRAKREHYDPTLYEKPTNKLRIINDRTPNKVTNRPQTQNYQEEEAVDLTRKFQ